MNGFDFLQLQLADPTIDEVAAEYQAVAAAWDAATTPAERSAAFDRWDELRRRLETWEAVVDVHFQQDTRSAEYKRARDYCDRLRPQLTDLAVRFKRKLLDSPHRPELESRFGSHLFDLWKADLLSFNPEIQDDLVRESQLGAEYTERLAAAKLDFQGRTYNHSEIVKFREHLDRSVRHDAERVRWSWYAAERPQLDRIFHDLVRLRHAMARKLGFRDFIGLGYERMKRVDYTQADVARFRQAVRDEVVPLGLEARRRQTADLSLDRLRYWDEALFDPLGNPAPQGDHDWMIGQAQAMFDGLGRGMGEFFRMMVDSHLIDLKSREGKAGGGFCTSLPTYGKPFIYANFNGTKGDVEVFTHEMGHALQAYLSRNQPVADYLFPTYESCEIHSMGLEFLTWPWMDKFFGPDAERFRRIHLLQSLLFLPYGVAVDHFQHLVYASPDASPDDRHAMWQEMERTYLPWRDYGDLPHVDRGGFWQFQRHLYLSPFYYIDYTLAQTCALQLWSRAQRDPAATLDAFIELCKRGGEAPFQQLARSAGLTSPFEAGCLSDVVRQARSTLDL